MRSEQGSDHSRTLIRFPLPIPPAPECDIDSATLRLYATSSTRGRTLSVARLTETWGERTVTWANQPGSAAGAALTASGSGWRTWSVTDLVASMYGDADHGFVIRDATGSRSGEQRFTSRERSSNRPQLVIRFSSR